MSQHMNYAASKPPPPMQRMQFQPQQFQQQQGRTKPKRTKKTSGYGRSAQSMGNSFSNFQSNNGGGKQTKLIDPNPHKNWWRLSTTVGALHVIFPKGTHQRAAAKHQVTIPMQR